MVTYPGNYSHIIYLGKQSMPGIWERNQETGTEIPFDDS